MKTQQMKLVKSLLFTNISKYWLFFPAFLLMAVYLKTTGPMNNISGDAADIWTSIKSFPTGTIVPSYVLYKGFGSVYPYVWLYQLSQYFGLNEFVFVKLFHCALFAYVSAIGFPYIAERLLQIKPKTWRKALLILVMFWFWKSNLAFSQVMVDLPSLTYFILLVNSALKISEPNRNRTIFRYLYTGLLVGLNTCLSGQYSAAAICVLLYILISSIPQSAELNRKSALRAGISLAILSIGVLGVRWYNSYFENTITNSLRDAGAWIPTGATWLKIGFMRLLGLYTNMIPDNRGLSIIKNLYGSEYDSTYQLMVGGSMPMTIGQYFHLVFQYPADFLTRFSNRLFISLSPDGGNQSVSHLFTAYTLLYVTLVSCKKRCITIKQLFSAEILLILAFISSLAAVIVLSVEMRYAMQIQGLIFTIALLDDTMWNGFSKFGKWIYRSWERKSIKGSELVRFPYIFVLYIVFCVFCFAHMASLYELLGVSPYFVLFHQ